MAKVPDRYLEERRQEILSAAARAFIEKGYSATTMQEVATACDLAPGTLYRYFPGKADLIAAVVGECMGSYHDVMAEVTDEAPTPGEGFRMLGEHVAAGLPQPGWQDDCTLRLESYLASRRDEVLRERLEGPLRETISDLAGIIRAAQASGEADPDVDADALALLLHSAVAGLSALGLPLHDAQAASAAWRLLMQLVTGLMVEQRVSVDA
ncbi:MAG: TetR/AcrR family transcriptional regulator [Dehalococcoidia bacterium]|nr:MAG: TetR/AcrR family transcriptional regulator [Dehalococcoidia bacterium]